jgi:hypothetical protein
MARYDSVIKHLTHNVMRSIKQSAKKGKVCFEFPKTTSVTIDDWDLEFAPEITLKYLIKYDSDFPLDFDIYGHADDESIEFAIIVNPLKGETIFSDIVPILKDALRHEIEHVAQNLLDRPKSERYEKVDDSNFSKYLTARHEIPAYVRGLYKQAKTRKLPLSKMFDWYFEDYAHLLSDKEISTVRTAWTGYAKNHLPAAQFV